MEKSIQFLRDALKAINLGEDEKRKALIRLSKFYPE
ncbi:hypothetical protein HRbin06_00221 [archaeon HR06]|nr:hypothetical protein HRbin06_00221 [archaeon HR06]